MRFGLLIFILFFTKQSFSISPDLANEFQKRLKVHGPLVSVKDDDFQKAVLKIAKIFKLNFELPYDEKKTQSILEKEFFDVVDVVNLDSQSPELDLFNYFMSFYQKKGLTHFIRSHIKTVNVFGSHEIYDPAKENTYLDKVRELGLANDYLKIKVRESRPLAKEELKLAITNSVLKIKERRIATVEELKFELFREMLSALFIVRIKDFLIDENDTFYENLNLDDFLERSKNLFYLKSDDQNLQISSSRLAEEVSFWSGRVYLREKIKKLSSTYPSASVLNISENFDKLALDFYDNCSSRWYFDHLSLATSGAHNFDGRKFAKTCLKSTVVQMHYLFEKNKLDLEFKPYFEVEELPRQIRSHLDVFLQCANKEKILSSFEENQGSLKFSWDTINELPTAEFDKKIKSCKYLYVDEVAKYLFPRMLLKEKILETWINDIKERVRVVQGSLVKTLENCLLKKREQGNWDIKSCYPLLILRLNQHTFESVMLKKLEENVPAFFLNRSGTIIDEVNNVSKENLTKCQDEEVKEFFKEKNTFKETSLCSAQYFKDVISYLVLKKSRNILDEEDVAHFEDVLKKFLDKELAGKIEIADIISTMSKKISLIPLIFFPIWANKVISSEIENKTTIHNEVFNQIWNESYKNTLMMSVYDKTVLKVLSDGMKTVWMKIADENIQHFIDKKYSKKKDTFKKSLKKKTQQDFLECMKSFSWDQQIGHNCVQVLNLSLNKNGSEQSSLEDISTHFTPWENLPEKFNENLEIGLGQVEKNWLEYLRNCDLSNKRDSHICFINGRKLLAKDLSKEIGKIYILYLNKDKNKDLTTFLINTYDKIIDSQINEKFIRHVDPSFLEKNTTISSLIYLVFIKRLYLYQYIFEGVQESDPYKESAYYKNISEMLFLCLIEFPEFEENERTAAILARQNIHVKKCTAKLPLDPGTIHMDPFIRKAQIYNSCLYQVWNQKEKLQKGFEACRQSHKFSENKN